MVFAFYYGSRQLCRIQAVLCGTAKMAKKGGTAVMGNMYGYARVSTREQKEDRQIIAIREMNVPEENIYIRPDTSPRPSICLAAYPSWIVGTLPIP